MAVRVTGIKELAVALEIMQELLKKPELVTKELDRLMTKHAPERTGHLKSTIYHKHNVAGAKADYAGWVEEMGKPYDYATQAIDDLKLDKYADQVTEPF